MPPRAARKRSSRSPSSAAAARSERRFSYASAAGQVAQVFDSPFSGLSQAGAALFA
jgi:hypothetical protein